MRILGFILLALGSAGSVYNAVLRFACSDRGSVAAELLAERNPTAAGLVERHNAAAVAFLARLCPLSIFIWEAVALAGIALLFLARSRSGVDAGLVAPAAARSKTRRRMAASLGHAKTIIQPLVGLLFVYHIFLILAPPSFHSPDTTKGILVQAVIIGTAALGMTMIIITAGIDLSAGSLIALGTVVTALFLQREGSEAVRTLGFALPLGAALAAVVACALCGALNGLMIAYLRIVPFIVTLGMMQIARGVAKGLARQSTIDTHNNWLTNLMVEAPPPNQAWHQPPIPFDPSAAMVEPNWYSIAPGFWVMMVLLAAMFIMLRYTVFGRHVFAIGSNEATARLCGINVPLKLVWVYGLGGAFMGVASVLQFSSLTLGDSTSAIGMELDIIAAVVIGGGSFSGGKGSVIGSVVGALIIAALRAGCVQVGVQNYVQNIVIGSIIIAAVGLDRFKKSKG